MLYLSLKAFHIISIVSWMAAMFYLPRLFVYHAENRDKKEFVEVVKIMELKLFKYIGVPAFWATLISGGALIALNPAVFTGGGWMHAKLTFVVLLIVFFFHSKKHLLKLQSDTSEKSGKYFRIYNEIPTILLILIVILVVVKPF